MNFWCSSGLQLKNSRCLWQFLQKIWAIFDVNDFNILSEAFEDKDELLLSYLERMAQDGT